MLRERHGEWLLGHDGRGFGPSLSLVGPGIAHDQGQNSSTISMRSLVSLVSLVKRGVETYRAVGHSLWLPDLNTPLLHGPPRTSLKLLTFLVSAVPPRSRPNRCKTLDEYR